MTALRKPIAAELPAAREALAAAIQHVRDVERAIEANKAEQAKTRAAIMDAAREVDDARQDVAAAPALQKRGANIELERKQALVEDLRAHAAELSAKQDEARADLEMAKHAVVQARGAVLKASASVQALFSRYREARAFIEEWRETLGSLANAGALRTENPQFWDVIPGTLQRVDPAWRASLDGLLTDPKTEIPQ